MNQINYCYFIRILFDVIQEKKLDNINSILLFYTYSLISYNTLCIYNLKLQKFNSEQKKKWYNKISYYNNKFYDQLILQINIKLIETINYTIKSDKINHFIENEINPNIKNSNDYKEFMNYNITSINEINLFIENEYNKSQFDNYFMNPDLSNKLFTDTTNFNKNNMYNCLINEFDFKDITNYLLNEYDKVNKTKELIEILSFIQNISEEQKIINVFWIKIINRIGPIGFFNFVIYCYFKNDTYDFSKQIQSFFKLNLYLYNGILYSNFAKNIIGNISPYELLKDNVFENKIKLNNNFTYSNNKNSLWFTEYNIKLEDNQIYDYPSEINILSTIGTHVIKNIIGIDTKKVLMSLNDLKIILENSDSYVNDLEIGFYLFPVYLLKSDTYSNDPVLFLKFNDWNSLFENFTICYLYMGKVYPSSYNIGRDIGNMILQTIDNNFNK